MEITLAKLTPFKEKENSSFADFDITYKEFSIKIKGCHVIFLPNSGQYIVKLPILITTKGIKYTMVCFNSQSLATLFFGKAQEEIKTKYPVEKWKEGTYSKFNQGLKKT